jgi:hypothetical protein
MNFIIRCIPQQVTTTYTLVVLCLAASRSTGHPMVFYLDSILAACGSLHNLHLGVQTRNYFSKARYWCVGSALPGMGKSPALNPVMDALRKAMKTRYDMAPGQEQYDFHIAPTQAPEHIASGAIHATRSDNNQANNDIAITHFVNLTKTLSCE